MKVGDIIVVRLDSGKIFIGEFANSNPAFVELSKGTVMNGDGRRAKVSVENFTLWKDCIKRISPLN